jgi:membrane protein YqaA with SNARE-associated domain
MKLIYLFEKQKLKEWLVRNAESDRATAFLATISFVESIFFPIPPDFILMTIIAARKQSRWAYYATVTTISSMLGGVAMYFAGKLFFDVFGEAIISFYNLQSKFDSMAVVFHHQTFFAILIAACIPIPESFKVAALAGGLFKVNLPIFILASIIGRGMRFFVVGYIMKIFGPRIASRMYRHFNLIGGIVFIVLVVAIVLYLLLK